MCVYVAQNLAVCRILVLCRSLDTHSHDQAPALGACKMNIDPLADHVLLAILLIFFF